MSVQCVAKWKCQTRIGKKIITFNQGEVQDFPDMKSVPDNFRPIKEFVEEIDLKTVGREVLMTGEVKFDDLKAFVKKEYQETLKKDTLDKVVEKFLDLRYRNADIAKV